MFSEDMAAIYMRKLFEALNHMHSQGIVHRDIKPENLLLTPRGEVKVADFGLAMIGNQFPKDLNPGVGSPYTMSPEQVAAGSLDLGPLTDVFSLGATLYEMLTLQRAFDGDTLQQVVEKILHNLQIKEILYLKFPDSFLNLHKTPEKIRPQKHIVYDKKGDRKFVL